MLRTTIALAILALGLTTPALAAEPHERNGFLIGFGVGGGSAEVNFDNDGESVSSDRQGGGAGAFRIGFALRPDLTLALESSGWVHKETVVILGEDVDATWSLSSTVAGLTWYPQAGGFYLRGGLGIGRVALELEDGGFNFTADDTGLGLLGGLGYEWRLTQKFALGPQLTAGFINLGEEEADDGTTLDTSFNFVNVELAFNWYW